MTSSIEGNSIENFSYEGKTAMTTSIEGKSIMNTSFEGIGQMYNSRKTERVSLRKDILTLDDLIERKQKSLF
ncbi:conserved domain protein [Parvimonas sp. oral taxon 393 str. F0440]|nr:conserved domain protein [Parvimonas sp. oral taxon 393 str. F0440]